MHRINLRASDETIQRWKLALNEIANISGVHTRPSDKNAYEYEIIETIVKEISNKSNRVPLHIAEYPVGLDSQLQKIKSLLELGSNDKVIMVGIFGIGGLGKTTIAHALYNAIADSFEGLCFLHDIKDKSRKLSLEEMQTRMLLEILVVEIKIDVNQGVTRMKQRPKRKHILLILDDVDKQEHLQKLAGNCDWFGLGSRIIITRRETQLLNRHGVERNYDMEVFNDEESLELLRWNAFRNKQVDPCYKDVVNRVICYAQGLLLALEVIGSHLFGMRVREWESALDVYKQIPESDIQQILKLSYDGLNEAEREIFLDIACFFQRR
ncbi:TMV resistance protein N-like [Prosopis cineraria]|uniref:TMV resistance protein N-like n=1 Tax=Prosopis cineraria TaxID=364024 RepID=UPI00240ED202|nr:TMV resistance protein N-like [Prosopis cineraria]